VHSPCGKADQTFFIHHIDRSLHGTIWVERTIMRGNLSPLIAQHGKIQAKLLAVARMLSDARRIDPYDENIQPLQLRRIVPQGR
jgi:hypothetical protein